MSEQRGGRRVLSISPDLFIEFCKGHDGMARTYTVASALPDDAQIVDGQVAWAYGNVEVVLESAEWQDVTVMSMEQLPSPEVTVHYLDGDEQVWRIKSRVSELEIYRDALLAEIERLKGERDALRS